MSVGCSTVEILSPLLPLEYCSVVILHPVFSSVITRRHSTGYLSLYPMKQCSSGFCMTMNKHSP